MEEKNPWKNLLPSEASSSEEITKKSLRACYLRIRQFFARGLYYKASMIVN